MLRKLHAILFFLLLFFSNFAFSQIPTFTWKQSLPLVWGSPEILPIGGTELRALVAFNKSLYAANGYWMDTAQRNQALPGAQVLRLDEANGTWQIDLELKQRNAQGLRMYQAISVLDKLHIVTDGEGKLLEEPIDYLFAGVWKRGIGLDFFARTSKSKTWEKEVIKGQETAPRGSQVRAFALHRDQKTGADLVFAGANNYIFSGSYNKTLQRIVWNSIPEWKGDFAEDPNGGKGRVASFVRCNEKLYAAAFNCVYERVDGKISSWKKVFEIEVFAKSDKVTGFRGLTSIKNEHNNGESMLVTVEDYPSRIYRIDPGIISSDGNFKGTLELDVSAFLTKELGRKATYSIVAYNNMLMYGNSVNGCTTMLMGVGSNTPGGKETTADGRHLANGYYLSRNCSGTYTLHEVCDLTLNPKPKISSVRTIVASPFAKDPPGTVYAGGSDSYNNPVHNTAWLYKGVPKK